MSSARYAYIRTMSSLGPRAFYFTDPVRSPDPLKVIGHLPEGVGVVFRHYGDPQRASLARRVAAHCRQTQRLCLIAADRALAAAVAADGVHWPEGLWRTDGWQRDPRVAIETGAAHSIRALRLARERGLSAAFLSPVLASDSPSAGAPITLPVASRWVQAVRPLPVYALGGLTPDHEDMVLSAGFQGWSGIGAFGEIKSAAIASPTKGRIRLRLRS